MAVVDYLDRGAAISPRATYLVWGDKKATYEEVQRASCKLAHRLLATGLPRETPAAIWAPNDGVAWQCAWGVWRAGFAWVPVNPRSSASDIVAQLDAFDCRVLFYHSDFADAAAVVLQQLPKIVLAICLGGPARGTTLSLDAWLDGAPETSPELSYSMDDVCAITPTGGTTGRPKGVMNTHRSFQTMVANWLSVLAYRANEKPVNLAAAPLTHTAGVFSFMTTLRGGSIIIAPRPEPQSLLRMIGQHGVTELFLPPTVIYALLDVPDVQTSELSSLRYLLYGAAPMSPAKLRRALAMFGPVLIQGFGQSEAPAGISCLEPADHYVDGEIAPESRLASCGRPFPFTRVSIRDDAGAALSTGEIGEICVAGDIVMKGYHRDPERTAEAIRAGWLHTGDVGFLDAQGFLHITDRKKDVIISGGFNIFSTEVEAVINGIAGVRECAVIGVPDDHWGEAVKAMVELTPEGQVDDALIIETCKAQLGSIKAPKSVEFLTLPRSAAGKILKNEVRAAFWKGRDRSVS